MRRSRTRTLAGVAATALPGLVVFALAARARADEGEFRLALGGGATIALEHAGGVEGSPGAGWTARGRFAYGLSNTVEIGALMSYGVAANLRFTNARIDGQGGTLFADLATLALGPEVRVTPGVALGRAFARTGPYVAARVGAALAMKTSQELLDAESLLVLTPGDDLSVRPFAAGAVGVEHRFGDHAFFSAELAYVVMPDGGRVEATGEFAWSWY